MSGRFTSRVAAHVHAGGAPAVIGLDPRPDALPTRLAPEAPPSERIVAFYQEVLGLLVGKAAAVKPNIAFFEAYGTAGYGAYERVCAMARELGLPVIGDIKRGDIGSTAAAYAREHFRHADALTLHPYMGRDSVDPFLEHCRRDGRGVFVLVRTSNPSARDLQDLRLEDGGTVRDAVARTVDAWGAEDLDEDGFSSVGAVVGATYAPELAALREQMPRAWFLIPGVGAQGGSVSDLGPAFDRRGLGALVNQSRGVMQCFAPDDADWRDRIEQALDRFCSELLSLFSEIDRP